MLLLFAVGLASYATLSNASGAGFEKGSRPSVESVVDDLPDMCMAPSPVFALMDPPPTPPTPDGPAPIIEGHPASVFHPPILLA